MKRISQNIKETAQIGESFIEKILNGKKARKKATTVCLSGDLGVGKTTFTQAVAKSMGIKHKIVSPTFVIFKKYPIKTKKYDFFYHVDAYRLKKGKELLNLGWKEIISDSRNLIFIEWPENVQKEIPKNATYIYISHAENNNKRIFKLKW